jgi:hypothetical protein
MTTARANSKKKPAPTMPLNLRHATAHFIESKMPGTKVNWQTGHGSLRVDDKIFCFITREGSLAMKLPPERIAELVELGDYRHLRMGQRTLREWLVAPIAEETAVATFKLLDEAKTYVTSLANEKPKRKPAAKKAAAKKSAAKKSAARKK